MVAGAYRPTSDLFTPEIRERAQYRFRSGGFLLCDDTAVMITKIYEILQLCRESGIRSPYLKNAMKKLRIISRKRIDIGDSDEESFSFQSQGGKKCRTRNTEWKSKDLSKYYNERMCNSMKDRLEHTKRAPEIKDSLRRKSRKDASLLKSFRSPMFWTSQSSNEHNDVATSPTSGEGAVNVHFESSVPANTVSISSPTDPLRMDGYLPEIGLDKFLQRPIQIFDTQWDTNDFLRSAFRPWFAYLTHPAIRRKLENYLYIKGSMKIQLFINGTQFHYGKGMLSYKPHGGPEPPVRSAGNAPVLDNVTYSQRPHILFDPSDSVGGDMTLPFTYDQNWLELLDFSELAEMGELDLSSFNKLAHANGATDPVRVTIFAYMHDDVMVSGSTTQTTLVSQSGMKKRSMKSDEYGQGVISRPATALARIAGMLTEAPVIGPFAMATQLGANAVSGIASLFGYCRPVNVEPIRKYRPTVVGNIANVSIEEAADKLTFDPKQELTIDPRVAGYGNGGDDLAITALSSRWSYLTRTNWSPTDAPDTHLFSARITPALFATQGIASRQEVVFTPMAFASQPFRYWRGSVKFRIQVACSKFHKGRLRVVYDPRNVSGGLLDWAGGFHEVFDISESRDIEITVGWNQPRAYNRVRKIMTQRVPALNHTPNDGDAPGAVILADQAFDNGVLSIHVLNDLVTPNTEDVNSPDINIFVAAGDDFEVAVPETEGIEKISYFPHETGFTSQSGITDANASDSAPSGDTDIVSITMGNSESDIRENSAVHFGETFMSFRSMLKRYAYHTSYISPEAPATASPLWQWVSGHTSFPYYRGRDTTNPHAVSGFAYSRMTLINYLTPAYVARRGGVRWKYNFIASEGAFRDLTLSSLKVTRRDSIAPEEVNSLLPLGSSTAERLLPSVLASNSDTWHGSYVTNVQSNPAMEIEVPYYSQFRYVDGDELSYGQLETTNNVTETMLQGVGTAGPTIGAACLDAYVATGEDFNLIWFLNCPTMYFDEVVAVQ